MTYTNIREYTNWVIQELPKFGMIPFLGNNIVTGHSGLLAVNWHLQGQFLTQLYIARPNMKLPEHKHSNVDDINVVLGGQIHPSHKGIWGHDEFFLERINKKTGESNVEDEWFKLVSPYGGYTQEWWSRNSDTEPNPFRLSQGETKANTPHGVQFGPGGGCFLTCQHWKKGKPTCIMDNYDKEVIRPQDELTWKDVAPDEHKEWPFINEKGNRII